MARVTVVGRGRTRGRPSPQRAVPLLSAPAEPARVSVRGVWAGEPGPPWPPEEGEPLRVLVHGGMALLAEYERFADGLARTIGPDAICWYFTLEHDEKTEDAGAALRCHGTVRWLKPGGWERAWWQFYRVVRDFRPHVIHTCARQGREWAKWMGQRWVYTNLGDPASEPGDETCAPTVLEPVGPAAEYLALYEALVAQPVDLMIVARNNADLTRTCLAHVAANTWWPYRLVLVDDASSDAGATVRALAAGIETAGDERGLLLATPEKSGCPGARNLGYRHCAQPFIAVVDNDMLVPSGWMGRLMATMDANPNCGLVAPWCEVYGPHLRGAEPHIMDVRASNNLYRRQAVREAEEDCGDFCCAPFSALQGGSDTDLNYRVKEAGWDLWFDGTTCLHHLGGSLVRMAGMTRRHDDGMKMQQGSFLVQKKWVAPGVRRRENEDERSAQL